MAEERIETGKLERRFGMLVLHNSSGHRWRLEVDGRRAEHLVGMNVRVTGARSGDLIRVNSIQPA
jgi:hypothetical protein